MRNKNNIKKKGQMYKQQQIKESKIKYNLKMKRMKIPKKKGKYVRSNFRA